MTPAGPILVTGASGFVGSRLVRRLVKTGADVHVFLRSSSDTRRLGDVPGHMERHGADLTDPSSLRTTVRRVRPRTVFHCASWGGHPGQTDAAAIFGTNLVGTFHLLAACEEAGFDRFVHIGSSSEYGMKTAPMSEEDEPAPVDAYGASKAGATLWCRAAAISRGLPIVTLRLFSPYGPWDDPARLSPRRPGPFSMGAPRNSPPLPARGTSSTSTTWSMRVSSPPPSPPRPARSSTSAPDGRRRRARWWTSSPACVPGAPSRLGRPPRAPDRPSGSRTSGRRDASSAGSRRCRWKRDCGGR